MSVCLCCLKILISWTSPLNALLLALWFATAGHNFELDFLVANHPLGGLQSKHPAESCHNCSCNCLWFAAAGDFRAGCFWLQTALRAVCNQKNPAQKSPAAANYGCCCKLSPSFAAAGGFFWAGFFWLWTQLKISRGAVYCKLSLWKVVNNSASTW